MRRGSSRRLMGWPIILGVLIGLAIGGSSTRSGSRGNLTPQPPLRRGEGGQERAGPEGIVAQGGGMLEEPHPVRGRGGAGRSDVAIGVKNGASVVQRGFFVV